MEANSMAAMREALRTLRQRFDNNVMAYQDHYFKFSEWHWHKKAAEAARWRDVFHELREACDAALAAPARNADRFATAREAANAWQAYSVVHRDRDYSLMEAFNWLFAPAKGEGK